MAQPTPFALHTDYTARGYDATRFASTEVLNARLAAASRHVRARVRGVDARIEAGTLDVELVKDVVCGMVARSVPVEGLEGLSSYQETVGPFQSTVRPANSTGDLYLTKGDRVALGVGGQRAGSIDPTWRGDDDETGDGEGES